MQPKIDFSVKPEDVTDELILKRCKHPGDAIRLCRDCSPLSDDEIIFEIEKRTGRKIQKSHFSEALNGHRNFWPRLIPVLEDICDNWIPTRYMALSRNQELKPKKEAWEIENEKLKGEIERLKNEREIEKRVTTELLKNMGIGR